MSLINKDIIYSPSFEYSKQEVVKQNDFRYYKFSDLLVPSVTSILRISRPKQIFNHSSNQADSFEIGIFVTIMIICFNVFDLLNQTLPFKSCDTIFFPAAAG